MHRVLVCLTVALSFVSLTACAPAHREGLGSLGEEERAYFGAHETDVLFEQTVMVGSRFTVRIQPVDTNADGNLVAGTLRSIDEDVLRFTDDLPAAGGAVAVAAGPGQTEVHLIGTDGEVKDRVLFQAAEAVAVDLAEGTVAGTTVDPRLPGAFAMATEAELPLFLVGLDRCGGGLLPVGVTELLSSDATVLELERGGANDWALRGKLEGAAEVSVIVDDVERGRYLVDTFPELAVTSVEPTIAYAEDNRAQLWGRSFVGATELVGLSYGWVSTERVTLSNVAGAFTVATIAEAAEDDPEPGPAEVDAVLDHLSGKIDLFAATTDDVVAARVPPPTVAQDPASCDDPNSGGCDPFKAAILGAFLLRMRMLRRARRALAESPR